MGPPRKTDRRLPGLLLTLALVLGGGLWIARGPAAHAPPTSSRSRNGVVSNSSPAPWRRPWKNTQQCQAKTTRSTSRPGEK